ncbi:hypothetical protein BOX15_Mlig033268g2 [Macrostomum lignano]|uniref:Uncharacterized protein n=2 Tax=Macrostomum lignano TaxID=282301 RepID=A0A267DVI4_9PLAT|nr:hypothetical protein BOX15_Mlig033268g1 [Macrostomum lignano]PAA77574.1 hypothetical protein BOX15_Mlig033268g2 [Macrostomum lignano]
MEEAAAFTALPMEIYNKQTGDDGNPMNDSNNGKEPVYTMAGILHFLQTEWTKFEMERSQWDVERAELQARIAFLQGERKGQENLKHDLVRRIKMLEFALKQERAKFHRLKFGTEPPGFTAADLAKPDLGAEDEGAPVSEPAAAELTEALQQQQPAKRKDGREVIKQYLQEMGYNEVITDVKQARVEQLLGSPSAAASSTAAYPAGPASGDVKDSGGGGKGRRTIEEQLSSMGINVDDEGSDEESGSSGGGGPTVTEEEQVIAEFDFLVNQQEQSEWAMDEKTLSKMADFRKERVRAPKRSSGGGGSGGFMDEPDRAGSPPPETEPTGPYPTLDDPEIRLAVSGGGGGAAGSGGGSEEEGFRSALGLNLGDLQDITVANESDAGTTAECRRTWAIKFSLRSHFDSVRSLFFHPTEPALVTASEDCTLKLWNVSKAPSEQPTKKGMSVDLEPIHTFRGHAGPVLCACIADQLLFSGGLDGTVRVWGLPPLSMDPYDPFDASLVGPVLTGHEDAVWGLAASRPASGAPTTLFSIGADRTLRAWRPSQPAEQRLLSCRQLPHSPTSLGLLPADPGKLLVSLQSGQCLLMDAETGQVIARLSEDGAGPANAAIAHPAQAVCIAAHEDRRIRFYDMNSGGLAHSMVAHLDSVTSLAIDTNGLYMLSGSHDSSIRLWRLDDRTCMQEITAHRKKFDEAIHALALHPSKSFMASAGADGLAKVFV